MYLANSPQLVHRLSPLTISVPLLALFISTAYLLFLSSDSNVSAIWPQCSPNATPSLLPDISRLPLIGQISCYMITFFEYAVASSRAFAVMSVILSFVAALLTIILVESARIANQPSILIRSPTATLLFFNLAGGAVAWQGIIVPTFLYRSRRAEKIRKSPPKHEENRSNAERNSTSLRSEPYTKDPDRGSERRHLSSWTEIYIIPLSIIIGYIIPSLLWLYRPNPAIIMTWLFFPLWVSLSRRLIHSLLTIFPLHAPSPKDLESNTDSLITVYAIPAILSIISHAIIFNGLLQLDDGSATTRAALGFIVIDFGMIALTVYYWLLLEAGWRVLGLTLLVSMVAGPGAGMVVGWIFREEVVGVVEEGKKER